MTNKDKFIEVFGFEPDTETMIPVCPPRGVECPFMDDGIYSECHCELWWGREYKAPEQEPRKGHWINTANPCMSDNIVCSECGYNSIADYKFCPNCGAKMESEADNGNDKATVNE